MREVKAAAFKKGDVVYIRSDLQLRSRFAQLADMPLSHPYAGLKGTVTSASRDEGEVKVKIPGRGEGWWKATDLTMTPNRKRPLPPSRSVKLEDDDDFEEEDDFKEE